MLAQACGIRHARLAAIETGSDVPASDLFCLARMLGVSPDYFFEGLDQGQRPRAAGVSDKEADSFLAFYWAIRDERVRQSIQALVRAAADEGPTI